MLNTDYSKPVYKTSSFVTNELPDPYHLNESIFIFRVNRSIISFLFHFSMKIKKQKE